MADAPREITKPKLLIGEGIEEVRFFNALLKHLNLTDILVEDYGGKQQLARFVKNLPIRPGFGSVISLGITRDADDSASSAFQSVLSALGRAGLSAPVEQGGTEDTTPRVRIFILPDTNSPGMLEDLCLDSVQSDLAVQCVNDYMNCVSEKARRTTSSPSKARIRIWLASQARPDLRLGEAAEEGYWPWDHEAFSQIKQFLLAL